MRFYWSVGGRFNTLEDIEFLVLPSYMNRASLSVGKRDKASCLDLLRTVYVCTLCSMSVDLRLPKECRKYVNHLHDTQFIVISFYGMFAPTYAYYKKPPENTCSVSAFSRWPGNMLFCSKDRNYIALLVILKIVCTPERSCAGAPLQSCSNTPAFKVFLSPVCDCPFGVHAPN